MTIFTLSQRIYASPSNTLHGSIFISWSNVSLVNLPISCFMRDVDSSNLFTGLLALEEPPKVEIALSVFAVLFWEVTVSVSLLA